MPSWAVGREQSILLAGFVALAAMLTFFEAWTSRRLPRQQGPYAVFAAQVTAVLLFAGASAQLMGPPAAGAFLAGWVIEQALSVDNLFIFLIIFRRLNIAPPQQGRALRWGIVGAACMRTAMIGMGLVLMQKASWALPAFGLLLLGSGAHVLWAQCRAAASPQASEALSAPAATTTATTAAPTPASLAWLQRHFRPADNAPPDAFFFRQNGRLRVTTLWLALLACELADVVFAIDSVPAVLSVVNVPVLALAANLFAVMGLRSIFRLLSDKIGQLRFLEAGLGLILVFIGGKMVAHHHLHMGPGAQVLVVATLFAAAVAASRRWPTPTGLRNPGDGRHL